MAPAIVLVMAEYMVGDSPLWHRGSRTHIGTVDAAGLGLSASLRHDLRAWNDVFDSLSTTDFEWPSDAVRDAHAVEAFTLASRVQLELGDDVHVWCGAGRGVDTIGRRGTAVPLTSTHTGTTVEVLRDGTSGLSTARDAGAVEGTAKAIVEWRALTERAGAPFGDAQTRALGLDTAVRLQSDLRERAQVVFYAGTSGPYSAGDD